MREVIGAELWDAGRGLQGTYIVAPGYLDGDGGFEGGNGGDGMYKARD